MIDYVSKKVLKWLISTGAIESKESDVYLFGIHYAILSTINMMTTLIIGLFLGCVKECLIFIATYLPLRSYAGGYHARTEGRCYLASALLSFVVLSSSKVYPLDLLTFCVLLLSVLMIWFISPVADENKPLDEMEIRIYSKRMKIILIVDIIAMALCYAIKMYWVVRVVCISFIMLDVILLLGVLRNKIVRRCFEGSKSN